MTFITALSKVLEASDGYTLDNQPASFTLKYFNFTANHAERREALNRRATSWLKNLFFDVCKFPFHDTNGLPLVDFQHYVVAYPISAVECQLGKELFCRFGSGYYNTGLGFNIQHTGTSVSSGCLKELPQFIAAQVWSAYDAVRFSNSRADDQYQADFHKYSERYYAKGAEISVDEYEELVEEGRRLEAQLREAEAKSDRLSRVAEDLWDQRPQPQVVTSSRRNSQLTY